MRVQQFIDHYCRPTEFERDGMNRRYSVHLVSPAAIMSVMPSVDSREDPEDVGLDVSWNSTFEDKREDNEWERENGRGPLVFLDQEGFRVPLCVLTEDDEISSFHNGNHRLAAAIDLGYTEVPVVFVDDNSTGYDERWIVSETRGERCPIILPPPVR